jgi:hypothetical protein
MQHVGLTGSCNEDNTGHEITHTKCSVIHRLATGYFVLSLCSPEFLPYLRTKPVQFLLYPCYMRHLNQEPSLADPPFLVTCSFVLERSNGVAKMWWEEYLTRTAQKLVIIS